MNKIKILFFQFDLGEGGAERVLVNLLNHLDPKRYDITLRTIFSGGVNRHALGKNIKFIPLFNRKAFRGMRPILRLIPAKWLNKLLIKDSFDIEVAFLEGIPTRIVGAIPAKLNNKKFAWVHVSPLDEYSFIKSFRSRKEFINIYNNFDKVAFVSKKAKSDFQEFYNITPTTEVVHNVNDYSKIQKLAIEEISLALSKDKINLISIGRLTSQKRFDRLIVGLSEIFNQGIKNWHLYLLGKGALEDDLKNLVNSLGLSNNISFLGFQENPYKYLSKMDVFVCSSEREGFSTAVTEAIFLGIPVISTNCAGTEEIVENGKSGYIVENSTEGLIKGLNIYFQLNESERKNMKAQAIERGHKFSLESSLSEFEIFVNN